MLRLTDVYGLDIRCVRLTPYKVDHRLLTEEALGAAFVARYSGTKERLGRWFIEAPCATTGKT